MFNHNDNHATMQSYNHATINPDSLIKKQKIIDSLTLIMNTHKAKFEKQYQSAKKTGSSEDYYLVA